MRHKPCPFCGGEADVLEENSDLTTVGCTMCGTEYTTVLAEDAWAHWDKRYTPLHMRRFDVKL